MGSKPHRAKEKGQLSATWGPGLGCWNGEEHYWGDLQDVKGVCGYMGLPGQCSFPDCDGGTGIMEACPCSKETHTKVSSANGAACLQLTVKGAKYILTGITLNL